MPGTRTAPTVGAEPSIYKVTFRMIDTTGDYRSLTVPVIQDSGTPVTYADVYGAAETVATNLQAASNASLYEVKVTGEYVGIRSSANALSDLYPSVDDRLVLGFADPLRAQSISPGVMAPLGAIFNGTSVPDPTNAVLTTLVNSIAALLNQSAQAAFSIRSFKLTERRDINESVQA